MGADGVVLWARNSVMFGVRMGSGTGVGEIIMRTRFTKFKKPYIGEVVVYDKDVDESTKLVPGEPPAVQRPGNSQGNGTNAIVAAQKKEYLTIPHDNKKE